MSREEYMPKRSAEGRRSVPTANNSSERRPPRQEPVKHEVKSAPRPEHSGDSRKPSASGHAPSGKGTSGRSPSGKAASNKGPSGGRPPKRPTEQRKNSQYTAVGILMSIAVLLVELAFGVFLVSTKLLPGKILIAVFVLLLLLWAIVTVLVIDHRKKARFIIGSVISVLIACLLVGGGYAIYSGVVMVKNNTGTSTEISHIGVYTRVDDPAQCMEDAANYRFGILSALDRENVNHSIEKINADLKTTIAVSEYEDMHALIDALRSKEIDAIVLNDAYIGLLEETEGYENVRNELRELTQVRIETQVQAPNAGSQNDHVFSMYISGIDSRTGLIAKSHSDVNIIATVNTETHQIFLLSTPRDYYVPLSISDGVPDKLTHAGIYGINVCMDTISMLYDMNLDYYFRLNFSGFEDIVDAIGGVKVYNDYPFTAEGIYFDKGYSVLDGREALLFARERKSYPDGDAHRARNQMQLIQVMFNKMISPDILVKYTDIMKAVDGCFETSMPYDKLAELVRNQLDSNAQWEVISYAVSGTGAKKKPYSMSSKAYVMVPDMSTVETAKNLIDQMYRDERITAPAPAAD